jgi:3-phenylpropionate/trans-cinnamate dioxygenase ferredoxin component
VPKVKVAKLSEIPPGKMIGLDVQGKKLLLANVAGKMFAMDGLCTHMGGHLWEGNLTGMTVRCPRHGSEFDLATGKNTKKPWLPFAKVFDLKTYPAAVEGDDVYVEV